MQIDGYLKERREVKGSKRWSCLYMMGKNKFGIVGGIMGVSYGVEGMIGNLPFHCLMVRKKEEREREGGRERRYFTQFFEN